MQNYTINSNPNRNIFRAYDVRGVVDDGIDANSVYTIGLAIGVKLLASGCNEIVTARDGRLSSPILIKALHAGLCAAGCDITDIGLAPSPLLYFATHHLGIGAGVVLTGSHNPKNYNGLKILIAGKTLSEEEIEELYQIIKKQDFIFGQGSIISVDVKAAYVNDICNRITLNKPLKVVLDCGNGAAGVIAPELYHQLGCEVICLYAEVDGDFPNHHPNPGDAANMQDLIAAVATYGADIGLAFDGDADRLGVVTSAGEIIWPDRQMMLFAEDLLQRNKGAKIVFDVKCSDLLAGVIKQHGGQDLLWKTGHSLIKNKMIMEDALLAGEMSGHIFFRENWYGFDDGMYAGIRMLEILSHQNSSSAKVFSQYPDSCNTPEILVALPDEKKFAFMAELKKNASCLGAKINDIDGLRISFTNGWGLVRASNTTPNLTLRFEASTADCLGVVKNKICKLLLQLDNTLDLTAVEL